MLFLITDSVALFRTGSADNSNNHYQNSRNVKFSTRTLLSFVISPALQFVQAIKRGRYCVLLT